LAPGARRCLSDRVDELLVPVQLVDLGRLHQVGEQRRQGPPQPVHFAQEPLDRAPQRRHRSRPLPL
jgi:hypothetical protein